MNTILWVLGFILIVGTLVPFIPAEQWWIRLFDFPRLQIGFALLCVILVCLHYLPWQVGWAKLFLCTMLICTAYQFYQVLPYTPLWKKEAKAANCTADDAMTVLVANVKYDNRKSSQLLEHIEKHQPDIVLAVETTPWWQEQLSVLKKEYPYHVEEIKDTPWGMMFFSRFEIMETETRYLVNPEIPSIKAKLKLASGAPIHFYGVHPKPPHPGVDSRGRDAELLLVGREIKDEKVPSIIAGDLNDVAWSPTTRLFQKISGMLDPRKGRGLYSTFNAKVPFLRWPLDHVFFEESFRLQAITRLTAIGSDHFPLMIGLCYEPEVDHEQQAPKADFEDEQEASEKISEGKKDPE